MKVIVPCAGLGTRMGMASNESKEMLWDTKYNSRLIDHVLTTFDPTDVVCISREEKIDLNRYLLDEAIYPFIISPTSSWMESVLASYCKWDDYNLLVFPDAVWRARRLSDFILKQESITLGTFNVPDPENYLVLNTNDDLLEKPKAAIGLAVGLIGFNRKDGLKLFHDLKEFGFSNVDNSVVSPLYYYEDLTRIPSDRLIRKPYEM